MFKDFEEYKIENFGLVRLPEINISSEQRKNLGLSDDSQNKDVLAALVWQGFEKKRNKLKPERLQEYKDRINFELNLVEELSFTDYFLLVWMVINKARELGAYIDAGRGSMVSSTIFYMLGITGVDPIEKKLLFARFISRARAKKVIIDGVTYLDGSLMCDADLNLNCRAEIVAWLNEIYPGRISKIATTSKLSGKILIKDVFKIVEEAKEEEAKDIADTIEKNFGIVEDIEAMPEKSKKFKVWTEKYPRAFKIALKLRDLIRQKGCHPSGYLISYNPLAGFLPMERTKDGELMACYDMNDVCHFAVKLDLLGLTSNAVIGEILKNIPEKEEDINLDNDPIIYDQFQTGKLLPYGLYQISADCAYRVLNKVKPESVEGLADVNAIGRPGGLSHLNDYVDGTAKLPHPVFGDILKETRNVCLYQETVMAMAVKLGFSEENSEQIRRCVGKKKVEEVKKWKDLIYEKVKENNLNIEVADIYWKILDENSKYGFNRCLSLDTVVETEDGPKLMFEVNRGEKVKAFNTASQKDHFVKVLDIHENTTEIYEVELEDGRKISCSLSHKFLCEDGKMRVLAYILNNGPSIVTNKGPLRITSTRRIGFEDTLDFEVDHPDHNFYAEGIVVSNSHSFGVSYLGALTVYLKYKYPLQYYLACLNGTAKLPDPIGEIAAIEKELPYFDIKLLPPSLLKSKLDFVIEDGNIRFGLLHLKGIADKAIEKLRKFVKPYSNKIQLLKAADEAEVNIGILSSLILSGCMDDVAGFVNRPKLLAETYLWKLLTDKEKPYVEIFAEELNFDLIEIVKVCKDRVNDKGKPIIKESRYATLRKKFQPYWEMYLHNKKNSELSRYFFERHVLGYSYSVKLTDIFKEYCGELVNIKQIKEEMEDNDYVHFAAEVLSVTDGTAKNAKKTKYCKLMVKDDTGDIAAMLFNENIAAQLEFNDKKAKEGDIVVIKGKKYKDSISAKQVSIQDIKVFLKIKDMGKKKDEKKSEKVIDVSAESDKINT